MRPEILRIDRQNPAKAFKRALVIPLDLTEFAKLLERYAIAGKSRQHLPDIAFGLVQQTSLHKNSCLLKERAHICRVGLQYRIEYVCRLVILFKLDVRHRAITLCHWTILSAKLRRPRKGINGQRVLSLVKQRDPIIIPPPPIRHGGFVVGIRRNYLVIANSQYVLSGCHSHNRIVDGLPQHIITEHAREPAIANASSYTQGAGGTIGDL